MFTPQDDQNSACAVLNLHPTPGWLPFNWRSAITLPDSVLPLFSVAEALSTCSSVSWQRPTDSQLGPYDRDAEPG